MNKKERFKTSQEDLMCLSDDLLLLNGHLIAMRKRSQTAKTPGYETYEASDLELDQIKEPEWWRSNVILSKKELRGRIGKIPLGHTLDGVLNLFAKAHPELVVKHAKTGAVRIRQHDVVHFYRFLAEMNQAANRKQLKNGLTAGAILQEYLFTTDISSSSLEKKIREFVERNPASNVPIRKKVVLGNGKIRNQGEPAIDPSYLQDFFKFAGLTVAVERAVQAKEVIQPKIITSAPDYPTDPTLQPMSDHEMDVVATRLMAQNITNADAANEAIFAEIKKIASGHNDR